MLSSVPVVETIFGSAALMQILRNILKVRNRSAVSEFYTNLLGMSEFGSVANPCLGYAPSQALLEFQEGEFAPYDPEPLDLYWKIGITVKNLDFAYAYLRTQGWPVSEPQQFRDIGYLCHVRDPERFSVELLQQGFEGNDQPAGEGHPVGGQATLAHLTLRVSDISAANAFFGQKLGMRLMSIQPVPERNFCLYFYSWNDEPLPKPDLESVENREWLWGRPCTLIELQHLEDAAQITAPHLSEAGFAAFTYGTGDEETVIDAAVLRF